jgi:hypothetical protein
VEENPHPIADAETGERTFFFRARRRGFSPARAFFATPAETPDPNPRVSDSSDEEISALPNGFGR